MVSSHSIYCLVYTEPLPLGIQTTLAASYVRLSWWSASAQYSCPSSHFALMASDRLLYIKWPFVYKERVTAARATAAVTVVCIFCFLVSIPPVFGFGEIKFSNALGTFSVILNEVTANLNYSIFVALAGTLLL